MKRQGDKQKEKHVQEVTSTLEEEVMPKLHDELEDIRRAGTYGVITTWLGLSLGSLPCSFLQNEGCKTASLLFSPALLHPLHATTEVIFATNKSGPSSHCCARIYGGSGDESKSVYVYDYNYVSTTTTTAAVGVGVGVSIGLDFAKVCHHMISF